MSAETLTFPPFGEESFALRITSELLQMDTLFIRERNGFITLAFIEVPQRGIRLEPKTLEQIVLRALEQLSP